MNKIYTKLFNYLEIGDDFPTIIMGVLNISPESFYKGSVYENTDKLESAAKVMISQGALLLDLGARSTAPWSQKITVDEELNRFCPAMEKICSIIPEDVIISVDTQYSLIAEAAYKIARRFKKKMIINDVSCLKTDPELINFIREKEIPIILMASKHFPGDLLTIEEIIEEFKKTIKKMIYEGYNEDLIILDPGIGKWIKKKEYTYDLKIIGKLEKLRVLQKPILVAISRKSFIGSTLNIAEPENRLNGSLAATAIAVFKGAHIVRTHDVNQQIFEMMKMATEIRRNQN